MNIFILLFLFLYNNRNWDKLKGTGRVPLISSTNRRIKITRWIEIQSKAQEKEKKIGILSSFPTISHTAMISDMPEPRGSSRHNLPSTIDPPLQNFKRYRLVTPVIPLNDRVSAIVIAGEKSVTP